jgi:hypothetical protein
MKGSTRSQLIQLGATAFASSLLTLFVRNFTSGEKKIKQRIPRRYGIAGVAAEVLRRQRQTISPGLFGAVGFHPMAGARRSA